MPTPSISAIVPMIHVADIDRSVAFYQHLGFEIGNKVPPTGPMAWCWLYQPNAESWKRGANLMLTASDATIDPEAQHALFYLYAADLVALRNGLIAADKKPGGICYPPYLPAGEFALHDPDGYLLMVAQAGEGTP